MIEEGDDVEDVTPSQGYEHIALLKHIVEGEVAFYELCDFRMENSTIETFNNYGAGVQAFKIYTSALDTINTLAEADIHNG